MLTSDEIRWGYRYVLGREPENDDIYQLWRDVSSIDQFRLMLLGSLEFRAFNDAQPRPPRWLIAEVFGGSRRIWVDINDRGVSFECLNETYEVNETDLVRRFLRPGDTFVDMGANIGWFSLLASTIVGVEGSIYAFEPRPETFKRMASSFGMNNLGDYAKAFDIGLADRAGNMNLSWAPDSPNPGGSHLVEGEIAEGQDGVNVELRTLDSFDLARCDFIKVDVEGAELMAMKGAAATLTRCQPLVLSELHSLRLRSLSRCSSAEYIAFMRDFGYTCLAIEHHRRGESLDHLSDDEIGPLVNAMFVPASRSGNAAAVLRSSTMLPHAGRDT